MISDIFQDSQGYIWITTRNGLQRYDGCRFLTYRADPHNAGALQTNGLSAVFEDSRHRLWIGSLFGPCYLFNRATGTFYNYNAHCTVKSNLIPGVWKFVEDDRRGLWVCGKEGVFKLNEASNQFENYNTQLGITGTIKNGSITTDQRGNLWIITTDGLKCYDLQQNKVYDKTNNPRHLSLFDIKGVIADIICDNDENIWISTAFPTCLYRYNFRACMMKTYFFNKVANKKMRVPRPPGSFDALGKDRNGNIIVTVATRGLAVYNAAKDSFSMIDIHNEDPYGLHGGFETFEGMVPRPDREDNIWLGSDKGINIGSLERRRFDYYPSFTVSGLLQTGNDGDVYIAYYDPKGGILRLDSNLQFKRRYLFNAKAKDGKNQLWCLLQDDNGRIWAPDQDKTILQLDPRGHHLVNTVDTGLYGNINTMQRDTNGNIWVGHWTKGLIKMDPATHISHSFTHAPPGIAGPVKNVLCLYLDTDNKVWAGTNQQGLLCFDKKKNEFTTAYVYDERNAQSISSNLITNIVPYHKDSLLIATAEGINIFDKKKKTFSVISTKEGLPNNYIGTMALDGHDNLWVGTLSGFCRVNLHTRVVTNYDVNDGLPEAVFEGGSALHLRNGRLIVPEKKGFIVFNPDSLEEKKPPPPIAITGFRVFAKEIKIDSLINTGRPLDLSYKENSISIEFASLRFNDRGGTKYFCQLEGVDKGWILVGKEQMAHYNQLAPGHYLFKIKCINRNGIAATAVTLLSIHIIPPFWNTWWFYMVISVVTAGSIFFVARWLYDRRKEKELLQRNYEKKIAAVEINTLRSQMTPHFIFNSLNSINSFILKNDQDNASDYLSKFSQLVRLILDNSRTEWVSLENELKALRLYIELESLRLDNSFAYSIHVDPAVPVSTIFIPPLIIQPYVENAIWHGLQYPQKEDGKISITIWKENDALMMQIEDNGVGIIEATRRKDKKISKHRSYGMKITAERLAIVNEVYKINTSVSVKDMQDAVTKTSGTKVLLTIKHTTHAGIDY